MYTSISFQTRHGVGHVTLNRPESANSLNPTLSSELMDAVVRCEEDANVRAVVITGAGRRFFCAGADLKGFYSPGGGLKSRVSIFHAVLSRLARADFPVIAAVNGGTIRSVRYTHCWSRPPRPSFSTNAWVWKWIAHTSSG
jgi:2-(1,2-epoxy-1,2-dihydrophenyl)acetyl-CoA isomerase